MAVPEQQCPACGGTGLTEKEEHTVTLDANGRQVPEVRRHVSPCTTCGGTRVVHY